jgi:hypothetical protein
MNPALLYNSMQPTSMMESPEEYDFRTRKMTGLDSAPEVNKQSGGKEDYSQVARGATSTMNAGGSAGQTLTSAGLMGVLTSTGGMAGPAALGAGVALSMYEQQKQAEAAQERARIEEEQNRKQAVQSALNQALGATRQLGV